jgi:geranylgeranyl diphosphate synthase type II
MQPFSALAGIFEAHFNRRHFPEQPQNLYDASQYILQIGGKRVRPVALLMANELFCELSSDSFEVATAIELFHNFSLIHDDIMDKAPLRRGLETVHTKYGEPTALLSGDVMLVAAYEAINRIDQSLLHPVISLFNQTAREVCEGQQMDMDFEQLKEVSLDEYLRMITLKTSVLLGASMQLGAILGGAGLRNQQQLYAFGKNLGIAFQIQDDYLDAYGDPQKFGKQLGGDILANKKTFLMIHTLNAADDSQKKRLEVLKDTTGQEKIEAVLEIFNACNAAGWAATQKEHYFQLAMNHLEETAVLSSRKKELEQLARYLLQRES